FPLGSLRLRFNTNHDKNAWDEPAVLKFGMDGLRLTTILVHTMPGVPLIYTGEEVANDRRLDLFEKVEVDWGRKNEMRTLLGQLGTLRKRNRALTEGTFERVPATAGESLYAFVRRADDDVVLVLLNFSGNPVPARVSFPVTSEGGLQLEELLSGELIMVNSGGGQQLDLGTLPGHGAKVYHMADG
ncbi:MAG: alpha-glucosidase C-terminal domain-containing protein, partial [Ignavibacteria bacterium]|nr:alpha-glucosidase C-terminal domain-containing protein [Ignavibacteria bacterium]